MVVGDLEERYTYSQASFEDAAHRVRISKVQGLNGADEIKYSEDNRIHKMVVLPYKFGAIATKL